MCITTTEVAATPGRNGPPTDRAVRSAGRTRSPPTAPMRGSVGGVRFQVQTLNGTSTPTGMNPGGKTVSPITFHADEGPLLMEYRCT